MTVARRRRAMNRDYPARVILSPADKVKADRQAIARRRAAQEAKRHDTP